MAQQTINIGSAPNDGTGDTLRAAYNKCNLNFTELYTAVALLAPLASPVFTGNPTAPTPTAGDNDTSVATTAFVTAADALEPVGCGRLDYVSATALSFKPYNGDRIKIAGALAAIPSGGITGLANTGIFKEGVGASSLTASTLYYVYAFLNAGVVTADFSTTGHSADATAGNVGTEIKTGNASRTLIGMVFTNASGQFQSSAAIRCTLSWFNRRNLLVEGASTNGGTTASTTMVEIGAGASRANFLCWGDEAIRPSISGTMANSTLGAVAAVACSLDTVITGVTVQNPSTNIAANGYFCGVCVIGNAQPSEGPHYCAPYALASAGTTTVYVWITLQVRG